MAQQDQEDPICNRCGKRRSKHRMDQYAGELTKCPVPREEKTTPSQEHQRTATGEY